MIEGGKRLGERWGQSDKEYVRRTGKLIKNNNRPWPNAAHVCEHRQRVPPCPCTGQTHRDVLCAWHPLGHTEHLCWHRLACTQSPVGTPWSGCSVVRMGIALAKPSQEPLLTDSATY